MKMVSRDSSTCTTCTEFCSECEGCAQLNFAATLLCVGCRNGIKYCMHSTKKGNMAAFRFASNSCEYM